MGKHTRPDVEQRRRNLKASDPELYRYVTLLEGSKDFDSMGDVIGANCTTCSNRLWAHSGILKRAAREMIG